MIFFIAVEVLFCCFKDHKLRADLVPLQSREGADISTADTSTTLGKRENMCL